VTAKIEFETTVLLLPQRQTVLVAGGCRVGLAQRRRLRLGSAWAGTWSIHLAGGGFPHPRTAGEQAGELLRCLWTQPLVD
jgi:hypothetical protein